MYAESQFQAETASFFNLPVTVSDPNVGQSSGNCIIVTAQLNPAPLKLE